MSMIDSLTRSIVASTNSHNNTANNAAASSSRRQRHDVRPPAIGKRAHRRRENALVVPNNPHATRPTRADLAVPAYTNYPSRAAGRPSLFSSVNPNPKGVSAPSPALPTSEPGSSSAGRYALSLRGVRQVMRRRGGRAVEVVKLVEDELRPWAMPLRPQPRPQVEGEVDERNDQGGGGGGRAQERGTARVIDGTRVEVSRGSSSSNGGASGSGIEAQQRQHLVEPSTSELEEELANFDLDLHLPGAFGIGTHPSIDHDQAAVRLIKSFAGGSDGDSYQAILELAREPGRLVWHVPDSFERLVVHLVARYYGLVSFSRTLGESPGEDGEEGFRITYLVLPPPPSGAATTSAPTSSSASSAPENQSSTRQASATALAAALARESIVPGANGGLMTPDPSDISSASASEAPSEVTTSASEAETETETETEGESEPRATRAVNPMSSRLTRQQYQREPVADEAADWTITADADADSTFGDLDDSSDAGSEFDDGASSLFGSTSSSVVNVRFDEMDEATIGRPRDAGGAFTSTFDLPIEGETVSGGVIGGTGDKSLDLATERRRRQNGKSDEDREWDEKPTFFEFLYG